MFYAARSAPLIASVKTDPKFSNSKFSVLVVGTVGIGKDGKMEETAGESWMIVDKSPTDDDLGEWRMVHWFGQGISCEYDLDM